MAAPRRASLNSVMPETTPSRAPLPSAAQPRRKPVDDGDHAVVKSAQRALAIFEMFDRERRPLTLKEICSRLGYAPSSGSGLLKSLVSLGYLTYDRRAYFPTMRIAAVASWVKGALFADGEMLRLMEDLRAATNEMVFLATQSGVHAQYVHILRDDPMNFGTQPGDLRSLIGSGVGVMLLAGHTDGEIEKLWRRAVYKMPSSARVSLDTVMGNVRLARANGHFFARNMTFSDASTVVFPVPGAHMEKKFVIAVAGPTARVESSLDSIIAIAKRRIARIDLVVAAA